MVAGLPAIMDLVSADADQQLSFQLEPCNNLVPSTVQIREQHLVAPFYRTVLLPKDLFKRNIYI